MTATSAGNGTSAGNSGEWSWFTPASDASGDEPRERAGARSAREENPDRPNQPQSSAPPAESPGRRVSGIRPVGSGAERARAGERPPGRGPGPEPEPAHERAHGPVPPTTGPNPGGGPSATGPHPGTGPHPTTGPTTDLRPDACTPFPGADPQPSSGPFQEPNSFDEPSAFDAPGRFQEPSPFDAAGPFDAAPPTRAPRLATGPAHTVEPHTVESHAAELRAPSEVAEPGDEDTELSGLSPDAVRLRRTMAELEPVADQATAYFYATLFVNYPHLRELFPASMNHQRDRLFKALMTSAKLIDDDEVLAKYLGNLGRGHRKYGTRSEHYPAVGESLMDALARYAPRSWSQETEGAWVRAYTKMSQIMIDAAAEHEQYAPAWWEAEVVSHERRTSDIAVITVRPDQPYLFRAGQYTSIETPWWPKIWRHYSFASATRSDGLLSFHVKAVPAGWVSNALVNRARPGDVVRLGPPAGSMTVDHNTDNGLLCLGGSTGIAPIRALVEEVAEHGRRRRMEVFYGARSGRDLYDIDTLRHLERLHPWLSVRPVISEGPTEGLTGELPDAVRQYGPWSEFVGYLSGPPGMIRSGVDALRGVGIPTHRIRHDAVEELVTAGD